ncbi:hypothetical protein [Streptomyces sp. NPDC051286]|uniref:hypothetical protein n=1 Tax=Streptomyces sp. NPDC051286 TaxID=3365647 RepID=UPI00379E9E66
MRPHHRVTRRAMAALVAGVGATLPAGCDTGGKLKSAGRAPTAIGPARLWPHAMLPTRDEVLRKAPGMVPTARPSAKPSSEATMMPPPVTASAGRR